MTKRWLAAMATGMGLALAGCAGTPEDHGIAEYPVYAAAAYRAYAAAYSETPFANGALSVVAAESDRMRTYTLVPCRGGTAICAGTARGRAGTLTVTPDYHVVRGLYGNRVFYLSPGGDGAVMRGAQGFALAWDSIADR